MDDTANPKKERFIARLALVRLVIFFLLLMFAYGGAQFAINAGARLVPAAFNSAYYLAAAAVAALVLLGLYVLLVRWLERRPVTELSPGALRLVAGLVLAFLMFCATYGILWALGDAAWRGVLGYSHVAGFLAIAILAGVGEELVFRGGVYRILEDSLGTGLALILSGAVFGGMHLLNPHATLVSAAAIALEAGVMLGAAYAATRNLWLPIGIHIGWNFTEGGIFGAAVSGGAGGRGIFDVPLSGPHWLTGGLFGPEASAVTVGVCTLIGLTFIVMTIRRGHWVPLRFRMMLD